MNRHKLHIRLSELEDIMAPMGHDIDNMNAQITQYNDEIAATPIDALGVRRNLYNKVNELHPKLQSAISEFNTLVDELISTEKALYPHLYLEDDVKTDREIASEQIAELTNQNLTIKDTYGEPTRWYRRSGYKICTTT